MADRRDQWRDQLVEYVDRTLERAYLADPMLYAELVRLRERLRRAADPAGADGTIEWSTAGTGDTR